MQFYKKDKIIQFTAVWLTLEGMMLSEISERETDKYRIISLILDIQIHGQTVANNNNALALDYKTGLQYQAMCRGLRYGGKGEKGE